ncbi:DNA-directed RNA polymerase III subunit C19 [Umbelopsis sp. PMI_123]|nr:DNA-directed RNA polymerase III subunit C19 [Umbelopsis sp. PMI_123]
MSPAKTRNHNEDIDEDVSSADEEMVLEETEELMETEGNTEDVEADAEEAIVPADKIEIVAGSSDPTCMTFCFKDEDHTLGNSLRHMIMKNPLVDYCGYSIPHPSEAKMNVHIQTTDTTNAVEALNKGFDDLTDLCQHVISKFKKELKNGNFEYSPEGNWSQN